MGPNKLFFGLLSLIETEESSHFYAKIHLIRTITTGKI